MMGRHFPECEAVIQEFWDYDAADQAKQRTELSHQYLKRRQNELRSNNRSVQTWK